MPIIIAIYHHPMLQSFRQMQPKKKLRIYTIALITLSAILFLLTISSLSITASNLMVTNDLSTNNELATLQQEHSSTPSHMQPI